MLFSYKQGTGIILLIEIKNEITNICTTCSGFFFLVRSQEVTLLCKLDLKMHMSNNRLYV